MSGESSEQTQQKSIGGKLWSLVCIFLPDKFKEVQNQNLLPLLAFVIVILTVVPLLLVFLASFWLSLAKDITGLKELRAWYLFGVREGFGIDEEINNRETVQNSRLDYLQPVDYWLERQNHSPNVYADPTIQLRLKKGQRAILEFDEVTLERPVDGACVLPFEDSQRELLKVSIGGTVIKTFRQNFSRDTAFELNQKTWKTFQEHFLVDPMDQDIVRADLKMEPMLEGCGRIHVVGTLSIFKNVWDLNSTLSSGGSQQE